MIDILKALQKVALEEGLRCYGDSNFDILGENNFRGKVALSGYLLRFDLASDVGCLMCTKDISTQPVKNIRSLFRLSLRTILLKRNGNTNLGVYVFESCFKDIYKEYMTDIFEASEKYSYTCRFKVFDCDGLAFTSKENGGYDMIVSRGTDIIRLHIHPVVDRFRLRKMLCYFRDIRRC